MILFYLLCFSMTWVCYLLTSLTNPGIVPVKVGSLNVPHENHRVKSLLSELKTQYLQTQLAQIAEAYEMGEDECPPDVEPSQDFRKERQLLNRIHKVQNLTQAPQLQTEDSIDTSIQSQPILE